MSVAILKTRPLSGALVKSVWAVPLLILAGLAFGQTGGLIVLAAMIFLLLIALSVLFPGEMFLVAFGLSILVPVEIGIKWDPLPRIGPTIVLLVAVLIGAAVRLALRRDRDQGFLRDVPMLYLWTVTIGFCLVSATLSIDQLASYYALGKGTLLIFGLVVLQGNRLRSPIFWRQLRTVLYVVTTIACLYALVEELTRSNIFLSFYPTEEPALRGGLLRVRSTFFHPIAFGTYLAMVYPFLVADVLRRRRIWQAALLILILVASFLTVSRGPWVAILLETGILAIVLMKHNRRIVVAGMVVALSLIGLAKLGDIPMIDLPGESIVNPNHLGGGPIDEASSEFYRVAVVKAAIDRLQGAHWVYGYGPGTFYLADVRSEYAGQDHVLTEGDSQYALTMVELGVGGLALLMLTIAKGVMICINAIRSAHGADKCLATACLASVVGFAVNCATASMFLLVPLNLMFWTALTVSFRLQRTGTLESTGPR
jgi:hypothetical protein